MSLELLESRTFFAVTMEETYPGFHHIYGDENANEIIVKIAPDAQSFTMNGIAGGVAYYVWIHGYGGDDNIRVSGPKGGLAGATIAAGDGNDFVSLNFDGGIWGGTGNDYIMLRDAFRGVANGEEGDDSIYVGGATVEAEIRGGDGDDWIDCSANTSSVMVFGGYGNDVLIGSRFDDLLFGEDGEDELFGLSGYDYLHNGEYVSGGDGEDTSVGTPPEGTFGIEYIL